MWESLEMDALLQEFPERTGEIEETFDLIMDTLTSKKRCMRISGENRSAETRGISIRERTALQYRTA